MIFESFNSLPQLQSGAAYERPRTSLPAVDRLIIVHNPTSQAASIRSSQLIVEAQTQLESFDVEVISTPSEATSEANNQLLQTLLTAEASSVIISVGGDGSHSSVLGALIRQEFRAPIILEASGNANDLAKMVNGRRASKDLFSLLAHGQLKPLRPLEVAISPSDQQSESSSKLAFGYYSIGFSALKAHDFNDSNYRDQTSRLGRASKLIEESISTLESVGDAPMFVLADNAGDRQCSELAFPLGDRMGKLIRFGHHSIFDPTLGRIEIGRLNSVDLFRSIGLAALGKFDRLGPESTVSFTVGDTEIQPKSPPIYDQADGETSLIASKSTFNLRLSPDVVQVLTSK